MIDNPLPQSPDADVHEAQQHLAQAGRILREALETDARLEAEAAEAAEAMKAGER